MILCFIYGLTYQKIMSASLPRLHKGSQKTTMEVEPILLAEPDEDEADSLISSNYPDDLANEQTWPTEEEMRGANDDDSEFAIPEAKVGTTPKRVKKVPKGTSDYQASWIIDDTDEEDEEGAENGDEVEMEEAEDEMVDFLGKDDETEMDTRTVAFEELDDEEEGKQ